MATPRLGELELIVMLSVVGLGDGAYGAEIRRQVVLRTGREYSVGAIYASLQRLEGKRFVKAHESDPLPIRGGRARRYFRPTAAGKLAVRKTAEAKRRFWMGLSLAWKVR